MRGKRFKAAVQAAFNQRGWTKGEDVTWKEVAHLVGPGDNSPEGEENNSQTTATQQEGGMPPAEASTSRPF